ncbi:hypothetical protein [Nonomuraea salmonea]|uniref:hypothetical protein n=1 Tax=Nonomuraea salmonea TaxID=46181 RepID=UPI002FEDCBCA
MPSRRTVLAAATLLPLAGGARPASAALKTAPKTAPKTAQDYYDRAAKLAGDDPVLKALVKALSPGLQMPAVQPVKPFKIFDDVAVVGTTFVQATALLTSKGVVLIDAMGSPDDAKKRSSSLVCVMWA